MNEPLGQQEIAKSKLLRIEGEPLFLRQGEKPRQIFGFVVMGIPSVQGGNLLIGGQPPDKTSFFHKEGQAL